MLLRLSLQIHGNWKELTLLGWSSVGKIQTDVFSLDISEVLFGMLEKILSKNMFLDTQRRILHNQMPSKLLK
jgi:hypothetical protein